MPIDQQFVEYIIKSLVSDPDSVHVERRIDDKGVLLTLTVAQDDLGRVIGKRGTTAQSLRTLLRALGTKNDARYNLKIVDPERPDEPRQERSDRDDRPAEPAQERPQENDGYRDNDEESAPHQNENNEVSAPPVEEPTPVEPEDDHSDVVSKTRAELEEMDDLDI